VRAAEIRKDGANVKRRGIFHRRARNRRNSSSNRGVPGPASESRQVLLRVIACGVCASDLHIVEGDLPAIQPRSSLVIRSWVSDRGCGPRSYRQVCALVFPGWAAWMGSCWVCRHGMENLCDKPTFTGYTVNGGYAQFRSCARTLHILCRPGLDDVHVAPLLCAGIIGFRSLRVAGIERGDQGWAFWLRQLR